MYPQATEVLIGALGAPTDDERGDRTGHIIDNIHNAHVSQIDNNSGKVVYKYISHYCVDRCCIASYNAYSQETQLYKLFKQISLRYRQINGILPSANVLFTTIKNSVVLNGRNYLVCILIY